MARWRLPERQRPDGLAGAMKALEKRFDEFQRKDSETHARFGARIGKLEAREEVRDEQYKHIREQLDSITREMEDSQRENKTSISDLRKEHKESMEELRNGNKEILNALSPLKHKVENFDRLEEDVKELKGRDGKTWQSIKAQALAWGVAIILGLVAAALGINLLVK